MVPQQEESYNTCHKQKPSNSNDMECGKLNPGNDMQQSSVKSATGDFHPLLDGEETASKHFIEKCSTSMANVKVRYICVVTLSSYGKLIQNAPT